MGRKPNPVIAAHFIRGEKHGQTTNRYAQTCRHCSHRFPTGRPETLLAHVANCPALSQDERADVVKQMFSTSSAVNESSNSTQLDRQQEQVHTMDHMDDFDISGLRVLAGAAENAEDMAIDPAITGNEHPAATTIAVGHPLTYYDPSHGFPYSAAAAAASHPVWPYASSGYHYSPSPFQDVSSAAVIDPVLSATTAPPVPSVSAVSFAPIMTTDSTYISHPNNAAPVSFVNSQDQQQQDDFGVLSESALVADRLDNNKTRKNREPYNESKRARVANMRHVGVCIRCSRLRKTCDPFRPCNACEQTTSKTWVGGCTTLHKGEEFTTWYGNSINDTVCAQIFAVLGEDPAFVDYNGQLEVVFHHTGPNIVFELMQARSGAVLAPSMGANTTTSNHLLIKDGENINEIVLKHAIETQEKILEAVESPALYATARVAQGLSLEQQGNRNELVWRTAQQGDKKLSTIYHLWLVMTLLTSDNFEPVLTIIDSAGVNTDQAVVDASTPIIAAQLHTAIESTAQSNKDQLYKFDSSILNQSNKHLFNLLVGMFLIIDAAEKYCCFMKRKGYVVDSDADKMIEEAKRLAEVYAYCVHNIHMMPKPVFMGDSRLLVGEAANGRVDHEMQRLWMDQLCLSIDDLEEQLDRVDDDWITPCGRLWASFFVPLE